MDIGIPNLSQTSAPQIPKSWALQVGKSWKSPIFSPLIPVLIIQNGTPKSGSHSMFPNNLLSLHGNQIQSGSSAWDADGCPNQTWMVTIARHCDHRMSIFFMEDLG